MKLDNKTVLIAAQYAAKYEGNFVKSLKALEAKLAERFGTRCIYLFPVATSHVAWINGFRTGHECRFADVSDQTAITDIIREERPDIIYTHFEGYDIPTYNSLKKLGSVAQPIWHMHDALGYVSNPLKALYQKWGYYKHYGRPFVNAAIHKFLPSVICGNRVKAPGIIYVCRHEQNHIKEFRLGIKAHDEVIPNGIDLARIHFPKLPLKRHRPFTFVTLGGRNIQKRNDVCLRATEILSKLGGGKLLITNGVGLVDLIDSTYHGHMPEWLEVIPQNDDICAVFENADCFISSSDHETFSYAVAEAAVYGLPVIQSDIDGTRWNNDNPSVLTFNAGNPQELAICMRRMMEKDPMTLTADCAVTRDRIISRYSLDVWCESIIMFLQTL